MDLWVEEFRPKEFEDVVGLNKEIPTAVKKGNIMHLLLYSTPGTGKSTTAKIIIDKLGANSKYDHKILNSSDERGIETIRNKINTFAQTKSSYGGPKIILLDEADGLTKDAQNSLRNLMETYSNNCKFILTANNYNKIIDALKSRCTEFELGLPNKEDIKNRLKYICNKKDLIIQEDALEELVNKFYPDIRKCINVLQNLSFRTKNITIEEVSKEKTFVEELLNEIKNKKFIELRQWLLNQNINYLQTIKELNYYIYNNTNKIKQSFTSIVKMLKYIVIANRYIERCGYPEIEFENMIREIQGLLIRKC